MQIMKNISKYILALSAMAFLFAGCKKEVDTFEPGPAETEGCYGVFFPVQTATEGLIVQTPVDPTVLTITVGRTNTKGAITVPCEVSFSDDTVLSAGEISFADGQAETTFDLKYPTAKEGTQYTASFVIKDEKYASKYNSNPVACDVKFIRVAYQYVLNPKTNEKAKFTFTQTWWGEVHTGYIKYYEVDGIRHCVTEDEEGDISGAADPGPGFWGTGADYHLEFNWYVKDQSCDCDEGSHGHTIEGVDGVPDGAEMIELLPTFVYSNANGDYYVYDYYAYYVKFNGYTRPFMHFIYANELFDKVSYYDGNGGFYFYVVGYAREGGYGNWPESYDIVGIGEGFTRVDYSLELTPDYSVDGVTPVSVEAGVDVEKIKYAVYEGILTATQTAAKVAAISEGTETTEEFSDFELDEEEMIKYAVLNIEMDKTADYTVVAVSFDKDGKPQGSASASFRYVTAEDSEEYAVDVNVFTEDTPARYRELHKYDSFGLGIYGSDLTEVHMGIFTEADIENYGEEAVFNAVKYDDPDDPHYTLSEEDVEKINGEGGLYDVATGLKGKTGYYVIVWATNGNLDSFAYDYYETEPLPYVWNSLGKGTLTDGFFTYLFSKPDYTVECDVYEEATTPGLYMITNYQLPLVAQFFGMTEEDMKPYEGGNWRVTDLIIDATNPEAVVIPEQDYGVCVNSAYGFVIIASSEAGTLKDNAITFPVDGLDVGLGGGWYYGNHAGTFKITLPAASAASAVTPMPTGTEKSTDITLSSNAKRVNRPAVTYERDARARKANVTVSYDRPKTRTAKRTETSDSLR